MPVAVATNARICNVTRKLLFTGTSTRIREVFTIFKNDVGATSQSYFSSFRTLQMED